MTKISTGCLTSLAVGLMAAVPASAEPTIRETIARYDVSGANAQEVRAALNRTGPFDANGRQWDAVTKWYVSWRYRYDNSGSSCAIASVTTEAKVNITMPRLAPDAPVSAELRQSFEAYLVNLLEHEKGHGKTGIDAAQRIEEGIAKLPAEPDCDRMAKVANELGYRLLKEASQQDIDYDAKTDHGATQGARWPKN